MPRPFPSNGTDAEKRAWADEQTAPKSKSQPATVPTKPKTASPEEQVAEQYKRKGQYRSTQSDHWWQTTDGHQ